MRFYNTYRRRYVASVGDHYICFTNIPSATCIMLVYLKGDSAIINSDKQRIKNWVKK